MGFHFGQRPSAGETLNKGKLCLGSSIIEDKPLQLKLHILIFHYSIASPDTVRSKWLPFNKTNTYNSNENWDNRHCSLKPTFMLIRPCTCFLCLFLSKHISLILWILQPANWNYFSIKTVPHQWIKCICLREVQLSAHTKPRAELCH